MVCMAAVDLIRSIPMVAGVFLLNHVSKTSSFSKKDDKNALENDLKVWNGYTEEEPLRVQTRNG